MTKGKFTELWEQIGNAAQDIVNTYPEVIVFNSQKKDYIEYEYEKFKSFCKEKHMVSPSESDEALRIDRHKIASCIAGAILSTKPLEYVKLNNGESMPRILYLANETLAFFSALAIVKSFIRADTSNMAQLDSELKKEFLKNGFIFPHPAHDDYLPWVLYLLQEGSKIGFNVLSFSNILYLLETYTFAQLEIAHLKEYKQA